jgi:hypothetical protein
LASRLEGANRFFGTAILASETTRSMAGDEVFWREIDTVRVKGRAQPVNVYEPLDAADAGLRDASIKAYAAGLKSWRAGAFAVAAEQFSAARDKPGKSFAARASRKAAEPPSSVWDGVTALDQK